MIYCDSLQKAPRAKHFAALVFGSIHIPGDERSRTNPGHGYPAEDKPIVEYIAFTSAEEMQTWVSQHTGPTQKRFMVAEIDPKPVTTTTTVKIG